MFEIRLSTALFLAGWLLSSAGSVAAQSERQEVTSLLRARQFESALARLDPLLQENPEDTLWLTLQGVALQGLERHDDAATSLRAALSQRPDYFPALLALAQVEYAARDQNAAETIEKVLALKPDLPAAHAMLAALAAESRDCATAVAHFDKSRQVFEQNPSGLWQQGACLFETGRFADAEQAYRQVLDANPEDPHTRFNLALTLFRREAYDEAIQTLTPASQATVPEPDALSLLADAYENANRTPEALETLQRAVKLHPMEEQLYLQLAELCITHGSYDLADEILEAGLKGLGNSARLYSMRGVVLAQQGRFELSQKAFEVASQLNADDEIAAMGLTLTLQKGGRLDEAVRVLREQLEKDANNPRLNYMLAEALLKQGAEPGQPAFDEALSALQLSIEADPENGRPHVTLGQLYLKSGDVEEAIQQFEQALELNPSDSTASHQLVLALLKVGRDAEAATLMEKVRRLVDQERQNEMVRNRYRLVRSESPSPPK